MITFLLRRLRLAAPARVHDDDLGLADEAVVGGHGPEDDLGGEGDVLVAVEEEAGLVAVRRYHDRHGRHRAQRGVTQCVFHVLRLGYFGS